MILGESANNHHGDVANNHHGDVHAQCAENPAAPVSNCAQGAAHPNQHWVAKAEQVLYDMMKHERC